MADSNLNAPERSFWSQKRVGYLLYILVLLSIWLPRVLALDRFVTVDEPKWLARSANYYLALANGDLEGTFTREHPGVTVTWAGMAGFLLRYSDYIRETPGRLTESWEIEPVLRENGKEPVEILEAGRAFVVLMITMALFLSFHEAVQLIGLWPAVAGFLLIAFDPFLVGLSRLLHLDGLVSALMLLSVLAFLTFLYKGQKWQDLLLSALAAGLAWLTKSPSLFLVPFVGLICLFEFGRRLYLARRWRWHDIWQSGWPLLAWVGMGCATFVLLWPSMWVNPVSTLQRIFNEASTYASEGHASDVFFDGRVITGDVDRPYYPERFLKHYYYPLSYLGRRFYPLAYLWRVTPVVLVGLGLAGIGFFLRRKVPEERYARWTAALLVLMAILFTIFMTLGSKKFDRYLLPVFAPLDLVAGIGWVLVVRWLSDRFSPNAQKYSVPLVILAVAGVQLAAIIQTFPYYLSYYNPLMGGNARAPEVMMIGWGEGLDQAASYLNTKAEGDPLRVLSWYPDGSFSYFFNGETVGSAEEWETTRAELAQSDYAVLYANQWQRFLPFPQFVDFFDRLKPEKTIFIDGLEYIRIYNLAGLETP